MNVQKIMLSSTYGKAAVTDVQWRYRVGREEWSAWHEVNYVECGTFVGMVEFRAKVPPVRSGYYRKAGCPTGDIIWRSESYPPPPGWEYLGNRWPDRPNEIRASNL